MVTSAICHAMALQYNNRKSWDSDMNHVWGLLRENYPDYFNSDASAKASLELLSGIKKVSEKIEFSRGKKDEIIAKKQADYIASQTENIDKFSKKLVEELKTKIERVKDADIALVRKQKEDVKKLFSQGTEAVDGTYEDCVDDLKTNIRTVISEKSRTLFKEAKNENDRVEETKTKSGSRRKYVFFGLIPWGRESYSYEVRTLRTGVVKSTLNNLVSELQELLIISVEEAKKDWKAEVQRRVTGALIEAVGDDVDLIDFGILKTALRRVVNNMELPNLDLGSNVFSSSYSGTIHDSEIDRFKDEVESYLSNLKNVFNKARDEFISGMEKSAKREKMSGMIFSNLKKQLESLEKDIENKEQTLSRLKKCLSELKKTV